MSSASEPVQTNMVYTYDDLLRLRCHVSGRAVRIYRLPRREWGWGSQPREKLREEMRMEGLETRNIASLEDIFILSILAFVESFPDPCKIPSMYGQI